MPLDQNLELFASFYDREKTVENSPHKDYHLKLFLNYQMFTHLYVSPCLYFCTIFDSLNRAIVLPSIRGSWFFIACNKSSEELIVQ